jgi:hypothetical protein
MKSHILGITVLVLAFGLAGAGSAQAALGDQVVVNLPYTVTVGDRSLEPGEYIIRQTTIGGGRVLQIFGEQGMRHEATLISIPAFRHETPERTQVLLRRAANDEYFLNQMWVQGKNYGYEFPMPERARALDREHRGSPSAGR